MSEDQAAKDLLLRLRRIEGQVKGIQRMIDDQRSCESIMTQLIAVRAALDQVAKRLVLAHIDDCMLDLPPDQARQNIARAIEMLGRVP